MKQLLILLLAALLLTCKKDDVPSAASDFVRSLLGTFGKINGDSSLPSTISITSTGNGNYQMTYGSSTYDATVNEAGKYLVTQQQGNCQYAKIYFTDQGNGNYLCQRGDIDQDSDCSANTLEATYRKQ